MADKKTYVLKADRTKKVQVMMPIYGLANFLGDDGKPQSIPREEFNQKYEPELAPVDTSKVATLAPAAGKLPSLPSDDDRIGRIEKGIGILLQRVNMVSDQVDAIHGIVVPPATPATSEPPKG